MPGALYFVLTRDHSILGVYENISDAREWLHGSFSAQYVAREDGVVVAYMSREGNTWRPIGRVPPEIKKKFQKHAATVVSASGQ